MKEALSGNILARLNSIVDVKADDKTVLAWEAATRGVLLYCQADLEGAIEQYDRAIKLSEDDPYSHILIYSQSLYNKACALVAKDNFGDAKSVLRQAITKAPFLAVEAWYDPDFDKLLEDGEFRIITKEGKTH